MHGVYEGEPELPEPAAGPVRHGAHAAALLGAIALWVACRYLLDLEVWPVVAWAALAWGWAAARA